MSSQPVDHPDLAAEWLAQPAPAAPVRRLKTTPERLAALWTVMLDVQRAAAS